MKIRVFLAFEAQLELQISGADDYLDCKASHKMMLSFLPTSLAVFFQLFWLCHFNLRSMVHGFSVPKPASLIARLNVSAVSTDVQVVGKLNMKTIFFSLHLRLNALSDMYVYLSKIAADQVSRFYDRVCYAFYALPSRLVDGVLIEEDFETI
jgi:hypothetical protein